jgi:hypothetical protein
MTQPTTGPAAGPAPPSGAARGRRGPPPGSGADPALRAEVAELYAGPRRLSLRGIAALRGVSKQAVHQMLRKSGVPLRPRGGRPGARP